MKTKAEHEPYKNYANSLLVKMNRELSHQIVVPIEVVPVDKGTAYKNRITVPTWAIEKGFEYFTYYIIHEISHHVAGRCNGHNDYFKKIETYWIQKLINCDIVYKKAYPKQLINRSNSKVVYQH